MSKKYVSNFVLFSVGYILLGILLIAAPEHSQRIICTLLGIVLMVAGIARIAWYFIKDDLSRAFHNDIPFGVLQLIGGIYLMAKADAVWSWLPVIMGFAVVFDSIVKLQHAFDLKRTGLGPWWAILALALATAVLGVLLILGIFGPEVLLYYFGTVLIFDGAANLVTIILLSVRTRRQPPGGEDENPQ
ncbi:DUF308 domain-containing protein [Ruminococcaceae bacterium OttesenSCG-928-D13]|nr:DUF308 domain-containing protein [Ruminococcaceae bacterium OttesenSCG-928-D13]